MTNTNLSLSLMDHIPYNSTTLVVVPFPFHFLPKNPSLHLSYIPTAAAMGLHLLVLAKLNLITATAAHGGASPLVAGLLVWPFVLRLSFNIRPLHQAYTDLVHASRLFFFQMGQIAFSNGSTTAGPGDSSRTRWARAIRLVYRRITDTRWSLVSDSDEENLRAVSAAAL